MKKIPGFTAERSLGNGHTLDNLYPYKGTPNHMRATDVITPAWWSIMRCDLGLCVVTCEENEAAKVSRCDTYILP
ncbi:hypothetical protein KSF_089510 [Reticulibacter mediterranei]|uniref:Uncharacterized protein n=1 Tax=Reticulibacter mediterranei TaxID=2778369 RepID=A0A8J3N7R7_9CHLR|nr:hypothetical protein KSF_089510 [Reticulibacter mediterranei]